MNRRTWIASVGACLVGGLRRRVPATPAASILNFSAPLSVAMSFQWKSETVPNALTTKVASRRHILANESVSELLVTGTVAGQSTPLLHRPTPQNRFWDPALGMYTTSPIRANELERLLDPRSHATFTLDLSFTLSAFFDVLLAQMTRTDDDLHNLANPNDSAAILSTFERKGDKDKVEIAYKAETHSIQAVPCKLVELDVRPQPSPHPPAVKLVFEIDFHTGIDAIRRTAMRKLIAMDWSTLARFSKNASSLPTQIDVWKDNVLVYLANQTDVQRGERLRQTIAARHAHKKPERLADDLRKDIDLHLVTANHWGQTREDLTTERHQALVSDLLGTLHQSTSPASPIYLSRDLARIYALSLDQQAALTLQYGAGYCGEHSRTSFSILRTIMSTPGNRLTSIVLGGNANIDHGFVLIDLEVTHVIVTTATSPENTRVAVGEAIRVFNLREALANNGGREVFIIDPYLDRSMMSPRAEGLLRSLNSKKKQKRGKDTDFLMFQLQHPVIDDSVVEDIRDRAIAERMALVKNV